MWLKEIPREWSKGVGVDQELYASWDQLLRPEECVTLINRYDPQVKNATIFDKEQSAEVVRDHIRRSRVCWIPIEETTNWLYNHVWNSAVLTNHWDVDVRGYNEQFQYTLYDKNSFYGWHRDIGPGYHHRKLSLSILLSDPKDFEGGEFEFEASENEYPDTGFVPPELDRQGSAIIFPSFIKHRIKPVTSGVRRSLVIWLSGPRYK